MSFFFLAALTELDVRAWLATLVSVEDQQANLEEEVVGTDVETTHLVEGIAAHHQGDEANPFTHHLDVMHNTIDSC